MIRPDSPTPVKIDQTNAELQRAREREAAVSTLIGVGSALLPDAAAVAFSVAETVHPVATLIGITGRTINGRVRKPHEVKFSPLERAILRVEDVFLGDKAMQRRLRRWQEKEFRKLNRQEKASKRRLAINKFMVRVGYPIEVAVPTAYAYLSRVPHAAGENAIQAARDVLQQVLQFNANNPLLNVQPNVPVLVAGAISGAAAIAAGALQGRSERNYQRIVANERVEIPEIADQFWANYIAPQSPQERVVDAAKTRVSRLRRRPRG